MSDNHETPEWIKRHFPGHHDPCPLNSGELRDFDGLGAWKDLNFINPPFSKMNEWVQHAIRESHGGCHSIMITPVDPSTKWWLALVADGWRCAFFMGRVKFTGSGSPNFSTAIWFSP